MTKLTLEELNVASASVSSTLAVGNTTFVAYETNDISIGQSNVTSSSITIGNVSITPQSVTTPALVLGGVTYLGGTQGGIIRYDEFTANGTWFNPLTFSDYDSSTSYSSGLTYSWYNKTATFAATSESRLDLFFTTSTSGSTLGGTGTHSTDINWADVTTTGAGGLTGTKPAYLPANNFSWMVEGYILAPETGTYSFGVDSDDAGDVVVNGQRVAEFYGSHGFSQVWSGNTSWTQQVAGTIDLVANTYYPFRARMTDGTGGDGIQVGWKKPSDSSIALIPANAFFRGTTTPYYGGITGDEQVLVMAWGGGGGAGGGTTTRTGGGGGGCSVSIVPLSSFSNTCAVTIGAGGAGTNNGTGVSGGSTTLVVNSSCTITAYGGAGGAQGAGGGGGGTLGAGTSSSGGAPLGGAAGASQGGTSTYGGGGGTSGSGGSTGGPSIFGGGGGGQQVGLGGNSIYGAAGGSGESSANIAAISVFGGFGGSNTIAPTTPGGGGGADNPASVVSNGARGEVRMWIIGRSSTTAGAPTYTVTQSSANATAGADQSFLISTTNITNDTPLYFTLNSTSQAVESDFSVSNGVAVIENNLGEFTITSNVSSIVEETFRIDLRTESTTGPVVATGPLSAIKSPPTIVGSTSATRTTGSTNLTITQPTYQTGDIGILFMQCGDSRVFSSASQSGWQVLEDSGNTNRNMFVLYKTLSASESGTNLTITVSSSTSSMSCVMVAVRNANASSIIVGPSQKVDAVPITIPSMTTVDHNTLVLLEASHAIGNATLPTVPSGYSTVNTAVTTVNQLYLFSKYQQQPGATGSDILSFSGSLEDIQGIRIGISRL